MNCGVIHGIAEAVHPVDVRRTTTCAVTGNGGVA